MFQVIARPIIQEIMMSPEQLYDAVVNRGEQVENPENQDIGWYASVEKVGNLIIMWGASGKHALNVTFTDKERLYAHWQGFKQNAEYTARERMKSILADVARDAARELGAA